MITVKLWLLTRGGSRTAATFKMELFVIILNGFHKELPFWMLQQSQIRLCSHSQTVLITFDPNYVGNIQSITNRIYLHNVDTSMCKERCCQNEEPEVKRINQKKPEVTISSDKVTRKNQQKSRENKLHFALNFK